MITSRRLSGLGPRSTHPPATIRSIDRLNVDEFAPSRSARLPIRRGPALVSMTSTRKWGSVTNSSAGATDLATTPSSARDAVRIASVVCARRRGGGFTVLLSCTVRHLLECTHETVARLHREWGSCAERRVRDTPSQAERCQTAALRSGWSVSPANRSPSQPRPPARWPARGTLRSRWPARRIGCSLG